MIIKNLFVYYYYEFSLPWHYDTEEKLKYKCYNIAYIVLTKCICVICLLCAYWTYYVISCSSSLLLRFSNSFVL